MHWVASPGWGGLAEKVAVAARSAIKVPDGIDLVRASSFLYAYGTSHYALKDRGHLKPGESLLVLGAAGGVGLAAVELGAAMKGYWANEEATRVAIDDDGWFKTGDAGYRDENGFLFLHDRVKDMVANAGPAPAAADVPRHTSTGGSLASMNSSTRSSTCWPAGPGHAENPTKGQSGQSVGSSPK